MKKKKEVLSDALVVCGCLLLTAGAAVLYPVAGLFVAGLSCLGIGCMLAVGGDR